MIYKEEFYKLPKRKRKVSLKKLLLFLIGVAILIYLFSLFTFQDSKLLGVFIFDEQIIRAPCEGVFKTSVKDMEKVRVGQLLGYIDNGKSKENFEVDLLKKEYLKVIENIDSLGEKINSLVDEIRIIVFNSGSENIEKYFDELKKLSKERLQLLKKLEQLSNDISFELNKQKYEGSIYSLKSGYIVLTIDSLVTYTASLDHIEPSILKRVKYFNYLDKRVKKDTIIGVIRDPNPKYLILFSSFPVEKDKYIIIKSYKNYNVKAKVLEVEFLKNFYKITTLPIEFDNIILKERIIKGKIVKIL